jgi:hypothetical protein
MTRYVDQTVTTMVQILNPDGSPATTATVTAVIYDEDLDVFDTIEMVHIANGVYYAGWQPDASGDWLVECACGSPVARQSFVYHIENPQLQYAMHTQIPQTTSGAIVSDAWRTILNYNSPAALEILTVATQIDNDAHASKDVEVRITFGGNTHSPVSSNNCAAGNEYYWALGRLIGGAMPPYTITEVAGTQGLFGLSRTWRTHSTTYGEYVGTDSFPLKIVGSCLIEARILDASSNPTLQSCVNFNALMAVE